MVIQVVAGNRYDKSKTRIAGSDVSLGHNEEKVKLPKESLIIGKHKQPMLKQKPIIGRMNILWSLKSYQNAVKTEDSGKRKLRLKRYNTKRY